MITVIRLHLMSYVGLFEFIKNTYMAWRKANSPPLEINTPHLPLYYRTEKSFEILTRYGLYRKLSVF